VDGVVVQEDVEVFAGAGGGQNLLPPGTAVDLRVDDDSDVGAIGQDLQDR
jgi:hypothetical protein